MRSLKKTWITANGTPLGDVHSDLVSEVMDARACGALGWHGIQIIVNAGTNFTLAVEVSTDGNSWSDIYNTSHAITAAGGIAYPLGRGWRFLRITMTDTGDDADVEFICIGHCEAVWTQRDGIQAYPLYLDDGEVYDGGSPTSIASPQHIDGDLWHGLQYYIIAGTDFDIIPWVSLNNGGDWSPLSVGTISEASTEHAFELGLGWPMLKLTIVDDAQEDDLQFSCWLTSLSATWDAKRP